MEHKNITFKRVSHIVTMLLIVGAILTMYSTVLRQGWFAWQDSSAREFAAQKASVPQMSVDELEQRVIDLDAKFAGVQSGDFETYFKLLPENQLLGRVALVLDRESQGGDYRPRTLVMRLNNISLSGITAAQARGEFAKYASMPAFITAQQQAERATLRSLPVAPAPVEYEFSTLLGLFAWAFLFSLPFAFVGVLVQLQYTTGEPWLVVLAAFAGSTKPWVATVVGALFSPALVPAVSFLYSDHEKLVVNLKLVSYAMGAILSTFIGGGVAGVAKAQAPDGGGAKKKSPFSKSITERVESDESGVVSSTFASIGYAPTHSSFEGIVVKGSGFMRTYGLYVQRLKAWKQNRFSGSVSSVTGAMTFSDKSGSTVYAVAGARVGLQWGRFSWNTPHVALEISLNRLRNRLTSAIITKPAFRITKRLSIANEWFGRFTVGAKPKITAYVVAQVKLNNHFSIEFGPYRTGSGLTGLRTQLGFNF
jgi:hypothetical protein